jgi:hypothetical protein
MLKCKSMYTPMEMKLKLLVDTSPELVDATLHKQRFGDVSDEYQARYMFFLESISSRTQTCSHCCCKTYDEIP